MSDQNDIGAKLVFTGEASGAVASAQQTKAAITEVGTAASGADRAAQLLNEKLQGASPEKLRQIEAELKEVVASGGAAGGAMDAIKQKLASVQTLNAAGGGSGGVLAGITSELQGMVGQVPGLSSIGSAFGAIINPEVASLAALLGTATEALDKFAAKQDKVTSLDAALRQNGDLTEGVREQYQALASQYGKLVGGAGAWLDVLTLVSISTGRHSSSTATTKRSSARSHRCRKPARGWRPKSSGTPGTLKCSGLR